MLKILEHPAAFVTLIAHEPNHEINKQLSAYFGNLVVFSQTQAGTASAFQDSKYKLFILDLNLMGLDVIRLLKNSSGMHQDTPVLALTNEEDITQRKQLIANGFDDCLSKPLTINKADEAINFWLNQDGQDSPIRAAHNLLIKCRYNRQLAATLYSKIFEQFPQRLEHLERALNACDYQTAYNITHALDSEARLCFLKNISECANKLGAGLKNNDYPAVQPQYALLSQNIMALISQRQMLLGFFSET